MPSPDTPQLLTDCTNRILQDLTPVTHRNPPPPAIVDEFAFPEEWRVPTEVRPYRSYLDSHSFHTCTARVFVRARILPRQSPS